MKLDLLIIDYRIEGFRRYAVDISLNLKKVRESVKIGACYIQKHPPVSMDNIDVVFCAQDYKLSAADILDIYTPKAIMVFAHRLFDYMFTVEAHKRGIIVYNFQHAIYNNNASISELSGNSVIHVAQKKREQALLYTKCLINMCNKGIKSCGKMISTFLKYKKLYKVMNVMYGSISNADISFVYGEYWESFYKKNYLEDNSKYEVVGYPELESDVVPVDPSGFKNPNLPIMCYLAQSSVEDGVVNADDLKLFLSYLKKEITKFNLVIKFHPRSDLSLYQELLDCKEQGSVQVWNESAFPLCEYYIGHESTTMAHAIYLSPKSLICRLTTNRVSPFEEYTHFVCLDLENLDQVCDDMLEGRVTCACKDLNTYVYKNEIGSLKSTAERILAMIESSPEGY